jgi:FMN reductase
MTTRMTARIAVVTAGLSQPSSTGLLADQLARSTARALEGAEVTVDVIELRDLAHGLTDNLLTGFPSGDLAAALEVVGRADALIAVTPVFNASYSGLFKTFFDVLDEGALHGKPVLMGATAGTARHSLVLEFAMRPLFAHLKADVLSTAVFAASEDFGAGGASSPLSARVERAGRELADKVLQQPTTASAADPFEDPTPFEELLRVS